jgi:CRP/FNR family transcriptional regulator, cyclic AMP receptor protein
MPLTVARSTRYRLDPDQLIRRLAGGLLSVCGGVRRKVVTDRQIAPLLELDPDLGALLSDDRLAAAERGLRVAVHTLEPGPWDADRLAGASPDHLGMLVLDGVLAREVLVSDTVSTELLGPGDVVRPWRVQDGGRLLRHEIRWNVLSRSRFALLDRRLSVELTHCPEVMVAIIDRVNERALRLATTQAISQLNRVDRRLLALFWHLAERWGRMTADGVALPMTLSHRMLGQLVGARRPTVSTALGDLAKQGELARRADGTWLLTGTPVGVPEPEIERVIPMRRRLLPPDPPMRAAVVGVEAEVVPIAPPADDELAPVHVTGVELRGVLERLRRDHEARLETMREVIVRTSVLAEQASALHERYRETRARRLP